MKSKVALGLVLVYSIFIGSMPRLLRWQMPCLDTLSNVNVEYNDCNLILASNMYIVWGVIGLILMLVGYSFFTKLKKPLFVFLLGASSTAIFLYGYYSFLPSAESATLQSNVYLDTFYEEYAHPEQ